VIAGLVDGVSYCNSRANLFAFLTAASVRLVLPFQPGPSRLLGFPVIRPAILPPKPGDRRPKLTPYSLVCCAACFGMKQVVGRLIAHSVCASPMESALKPLALRGPSTGASRCRSIRVLGALLTSVWVILHEVAYFFVAANLFRNFRKSCHDLAFGNFRLS
jgi:hypothetical protein